MTETTNKKLADIVFKVLEEDMHPETAQQCTGRIWIAWN